MNTHQEAGEKPAGPVYVPCLEDEPDTISDQIEIIRAHHLVPAVLKRPYDLGNWISEHPRERIGGFVLDMHMRAVPNLEEIELPEVDTLGGDAVGLAVAEKYLRGVLRVRFGRTPVAFLTGFPVQREVQARIKQLSRSGKANGSQNVQLLSKGNSQKNLTEFEAFISSIAQRNPHASEAAVIDHLVKGRERIEPDRERYEELVNIGLGIAEDLHFTIAERADLFGWTIDSEEAWDDLRRTIESQISTDVCDRMTWLIELKAVLEAVFGEDNIEAQRRWMSTKFELLGGHSAKDVLHDGHHYNFVKLVSVARRMTG